MIAEQLDFVQTYSMKFNVLILLVYLMYSYMESSFP